MELSYQPQFSRFLFNPSSPPAPRKMEARCLSSTSAIFNPLSGGIGTLKNISQAKGSLSKTYSSPVGHSHSRGNHVFASRCTFYSKGKLNVSHDYFKRHNQVRDPRYIVARSEIAGTVKTRPQKLCHRQSSVIRCEDPPQNADFPRYYSKKEKKPFPIPIVELRRNARQRIKDRKGKPKGQVPPPKNGLLVKRMIPLAYSVYNARITLINNLKKLLKVVPVLACKWCNEIHVGPVGHPFKSCRGPNASIRTGHHEWTKAMVEDILIPVDAYHLFDRLGKRIPHEERFSVPRVPAVVELCIQAGVDLPEFPTKRRRKPIIRINKSEFVDADESELPDPDPDVPKPIILTEENFDELVVPSNAEETVLLAEETLQAWEKMRVGSNRLMKMYPVRVCGYCPEVHVGGSGHKAQNCGAHKHQQRNGQHGWQSAVLDDLIPPRYVWHVPDLSKPELQRELRNFYGQAPAVVEICVQGGAAAPERYQPTMRLNVGIPSTVKEAEMVV